MYSAKLWRWKVRRIWRMASDLSKFSLSIFSLLIFFLWRLQSIRQSFARQTFWHAWFIKFCKTFPPVKVLCLYGRSTYIMQSGTARLLWKPRIDLFVNIISNPNLVNRHWWGTVSNTLEKSNSITVRKSTCFLLVHSMLNILNKINQLGLKGISWSKTMLKFAQNIVIL